MPNIRNLIPAVLVVLLIAIPSVCFSGAWVLPKGEWFTKTEFQLYRTCEFWSRRSNLKSGSCYHQDQLNPYIEYGVTRKLTVGISPFFRNIDFETIHERFALDNSEVLGRYLFWEGDYSAFSAQLTVNVPFRGDRIEQDTLPAGSPPASAIAPFALAQRQWYTDGRLLFGTGGVFNKQRQDHWYVDFQVSYREYYEGAADQAHLDLTQAWKSPTNRVEIMLKELFTLSMDNPRNIQQPNYDLITIEPSVLLWIKRQYVGVQFGILQDLYGKNIGKATTPFISLWVLFNKQ